MIQRLKTEQAVEEAPVVTKAPKERNAVSGSDLGIVVEGVEDVLVRLAKCCTPVPGDGIVGYISLGRGITIHREDCPNVRALKRQPERFTPVDWDGGGTTSFRVQIAVSSWDRPRLLEDVARTFAEHGANIVSYGGVVEDQLAKNWYTVEIGDVESLRSLMMLWQRGFRLRRLPRRANDAVPGCRPCPSRPGNAGDEDGDALRKARSSQPSITSPATRSRGRRPARGSLGAASRRGRARARPARRRGSSPAQRRVDERVDDLAQDVVDPPPR